jgi:hypothetical protein
MPGIAPGGSLKGMMGVAKQAVDDPGCMVYRGIVYEVEADGATRERHKDRHCYGGSKWEAHQRPTCRILDPKEDGGSSGDVDFPSVGRGSQAWKGHATIAG